MTAHGTRITPLPNSREFFELLDAAVERAYRYPITYCSQCGGAFGPGDSGYSHCEDHNDVKEIDNA